MSLSTTKFDDSADATDFFDRLKVMLKDPRAQHWMSATDSIIGQQWAEQASNLEEIVDQLDNPEYN